MRTIAICGALFLLSSVRAQAPDSTSILTETDGLPAMPRDPATRPRHLLSIEAGGAYDLSTVYNDLVLGLLRGDVLGQPVRQRSQDALDPSSNRAGYAIDGAISYTWGDSLSGIGGWRPRITVAHHDVMGLRFTRDAYDLTFFGNAAYEDRVAQLAPSAFTLMRYQTIGFGVEHARSGSWLTLELVNGSSLNTGDIDRADLFTAVDGRYLDLDINGRYRGSDPAGNGYLRQNGLGAAVSGQWNFFPRLFGHRSVLGVRLDDAGFVTWNSNAQRVDKDSVVHYTGIRVEDVIDLGGTLIGSSRLQDSLGFGYTHGSFLRPLPARLSAHLRIFSRNLRWHYDLSADQRYLPGYVPHGTIGLTRRFGKTAVSVEGGYGGFGGLRMGAGLQTVIARHCLFTLRSSNVPGTISEQARGMALFAGLELRW
ncbi:MAG: hypothetical protein QM724_09815 [Flavobacteriales bacterium]